MVTINFLQSESVSFLTDSEALAFISGVLRSRNLLFRSCRIERGNLSFLVEVRN